MNYTLEDESKIKYFKEEISFLVQIYLLIGIILIISNFIISIAITRGTSMTPTLEDKDIVMLNKYKTTLKIKNYSRGDIVVFKDVIEEDSKLVKRIVALEGDIVNVKDGKLYVNNNEVQENYIMGETYIESMYLQEFKDDYEDVLSENDIYEYVVPENHVFVLGDCRWNSLDSRFFGGVDLENIIGKVVFRVYPFSKIKKL